MTDQKRKPLSKKIRFEVFKRDGFRCVYCGKNPPDVVLEVDHIEPVSKGGSNDINNLTTACFACNRGKTNIPLDKIPQTLANNLETLKVKEQQLKEYRKYIKTIKKREDKDIEDIHILFKQQFPKKRLTTEFLNTSLRYFLKIFPKHEIEDAWNTAFCKQLDPEATTKYFCGICWRRKDERKMKQIEVSE